MSDEEMTVEQTELDEHEQPEPPVRFELVQDKLFGTVNLHDMRQGDEAFECWSFVSEGMLALGQKELAILLRKEPGESEKDYPTEPLGFFLTVWNFASQGNFVFEGDITEFGDSGFLDPQFRALAYLRPLGLSGMEDNEGLLSCVLLTEKELQIARRFGLTRVISLFGYRFNHYPCPPWTNRSRESVVDDELISEMEESILGKVPLLGLPGAKVVLSANRLVLSCRKGTHVYINEVLKQLPEEAPFLISTDIDPQANAMLVWQATMEKGPSAITPPGSDGSRVAASAVLIFPEQEASNAQVIEDSFLLSITTEDWRKLREGLMTGEDTSINTEGGGHIAIEWYEAEGFPQITNRGALPELPRIEHKEGLGSVTSAELQVEDAVLIASTDPMVFYQFVEAVEMTVLGYFVDRAPESERKITLGCQVSQAGKIDWTISSDPEEDKLVLKGIELRLSDLPAPEIHGEPVSFELEFQVNARADG